MHPRNIYKDNPPDFKELAIKYPYFRRHSRENTSGAVMIDFKDPAALRALTCALLENDFDLKIEIPLDRLIPTVPLRLNYLLWIEDLIGCLPGNETQTSVIGIDIGTGTSCIYPLLGAKLSEWNFIATEVDESSVRYAENNIKKNGFTDKISVQHVSPGSYLIKPLEDANLEQATFCMCNPPFFSSEDEAALGSARTDKRPLPISVNTGSTKETVTSGGEVEFVKQIIDDSLQLRDKVSWYTTMIGKKSSMQSVLAHLREQKEVMTVTTTTFKQGKTMRWGVAWTFISDISVDSVNPPPAKRQKKQNKPLTFIVPCDCVALKSKQKDSTFEQVIRLIKDLLVDLKILIEEHQFSREVCSYRCSATEITWSQQRKKRRELQRLEHLWKSSSVVMDKNKLQENKHCESEDGECAQTYVETPIKNVFSSGTTDAVKTGFVKQHENDDRNHLKSSKNTEYQKQRKSGEVKDSLLKTLQSNTDIPSDIVNATTVPLCIFWVRLKAKAGTREETLVEVECIQANNKNDVYQLYQYLQNKTLKGK